MTEYILALDMSLTSTGVVLASDDGVYQRTVIKSKPNGSNVIRRMERYSKIILEVGVFVHGHTLETPTIFIEGYSFGSRGRSTLNIGELGGMVRSHMLEFYQHKCPIHEIAPTSLKKFITGKGNANKIAMVSAMTKRYDEYFETDDEADAYGLAKLGECVLGWRETETDYQYAAIEKIRKGMVE